MRTILMGNSGGTMKSNEPIDEVLDWEDYAIMPKFELQERALADDKKAQQIYLERYGKE